MKGGIQMIINHDHSYVNALDNEFVARGYAEDDLFSIRLTYEYTQELSLIHI